MEHRALLKGNEKMPQEQSNFSQTLSAANKPNINHCTLDMIWVKNLEVLISETQAA